MGVVLRLPVRDVMAGQVVTTTRRATALEAAAAMRDHNTGSLVVLDGSRPVGIVTERDIVRKVVADGRRPDAPVGDIMSEPLLTIAPDADVVEAARAMARHRVRRLPILGSEGLRGMITERDILAISPALIELWREEENLPHAAREAWQGVCEGCNSLVDSLRAENGLLLCEDCAEEAL